MATRLAVGEPFGNVTPVLTTQYDESFPHISSDDLELYFGSFDWPGGKGGRDLYVMRRENPHDPFGPVEPLDEINSEYNEGNPTLSPDGLTLFWDDVDTANVRPGGQGSVDIWRATRPAKDAPFGPPINLGLPINTKDAEGGVAVSFDWPAPGSTIYFGRESPNTNTLDIHQATWHPDWPFRRGDANVDGQVDVSDPIETLGFLFLGDPATLDCDDAADCNDDGLLDVSDPVSSLGYIFVGKPPVISAPGTNLCGLDPSEDNLTCELYAPLNGPCP